MPVKVLVSAFAMGWAAWAGFGISQLSKGNSITQTINADSNKEELKELSQEVKFAKWKENLEQQRKGKFDPFKDRERQNYNYKNYGSVKITKISK